MPFIVLLKLGSFRNLTSVSFNSDSASFTDRKAQASGKRLQPRTGHGGPSKEGRWDWQQCRIYSAL